MKETDDKIIESFPKRNQIQMVMDTTKERINRELKKTDEKIKNELPVRDQIQTVMDTTRDKLNSGIIGTDEDISNEMIARCQLQTAMNSTRDKLNMGSFDEDTFDIVPLTIKDERIPEEFDGYTIVHLTDLHIGQWMNREKLEGVIDIANNLTPDMVALTGDYISYQIDYLDDLKCLKDLKAKDVKISVLGNHDYWINSEKIKDMLKECGIINLENEVYVLERGDAKLQIAGIDSITEGHDDIDKVKEQLLPGVGAIMLVHEPDFADTSAQIDEAILELSGHSHGGQIGVPMIGTPVRGKNFVKYPIGEYKLNNMIQYTSRGLGTNAFWFRINCPPEITKITLRSENK